MERPLLVRVRDQNAVRARTLLAEVAQLAAELTEASNGCRRMILGLDTIRILARVESRKSRQSQDVLTATIDKIDTVQAAISKSLGLLMGRTQLIEQSLADLRGTGTAMVLAAV